MIGQQITVVDDFETLIARAGFTKEGLGEAAGLSRTVVFRAVNPEGNGGGSLRRLSAWNIARAYGAAVGITQDAAFAELFVVTGEAYHGTLAHGSVDAAPAGGSVMDRDTPEHVVQPRHQEPSAVQYTALKKTAILRLDEESSAMLDALVQDEDRSSQREMIRVLIKRAYRALIARRATTHTTRLDAPSTDDVQNEPR